MKLSALQIQLAFVPCPHVIAADADYQSPTLRWLQGPFYQWFRGVRWASNLDRWERTNDCDNFARAYAQAAQDCHALTTGTRAEGLAVGEFFYRQDTGGLHAIVVAFVDGQTTPTFIEPQNNKVLDLSQAERASPIFVRF